MSDENPARPNVLTIDTNSDATFDLEDTNDAGNRWLTEIKEFIM
jgi:hypothetical protein